jgi:hypothetical protein
MKLFETILHQYLNENKFLSEKQNEDYLSYKSKNIFSLNSELLTFLYISVLLFTSGIGIVIYQNIDSIGHIAILLANFILMAACFYFCFKKAKGYSNNEVIFDNQLYDYVLLTGSILAGIFLSYINYQYQIFGKSYEWVSLLSAILFFTIAYYFDNKTVLSLGITSLIAFIGISLTPKEVFDNQFFDNLVLIYSGVLLSVVLVVWMKYSIKNNIKKHFQFLYATFAQHLAGICIISGLLSDHWYIFIVLSAVFVYYFYKESYLYIATSTFVFTLVYGYIYFNIVLYRLMDFIDFSEIYLFIGYLAPLFYIGSIVLFIKLVRNFNKKKNDSIQ